MGGLRGCLAGHCVNRRKEIESGYAIKALDD